MRAGIDVRSESHFVAVPSGRGGAVGKGQAFRRIWSGWPETGCSRAECGRWRWNRPASTGSPCTSCSRPRGSRSSWSTPATPTSCGPPQDGPPRLPVDLPAALRRPAGRGLPARRADLPAAGLPAAAGQPGPLRQPARAAHAEGPGADEPEADGVLSDITGLTGLARRRRHPGRRADPRRLARAAATSVPATMRPPSPRRWSARGADEHLFTLKQARELYRAVPAPDCRVRRADRGAPQSVVDGPWSRRPRVCHPRGGARPRGQLLGASVWSARAVK